MGIKKIRLGVNIDHVATVRNARGTIYPDPTKAAEIAKAAGADGITAHLREDRRHIVESDIENITKHVDLPLNFEMAATDEMRKVALQYRPHAICIVPENRLELTTEGGLDVAANVNYLKEFIMPLKKVGSRVSIFLAADYKQIDAAKNVGASVVELHTGEYCDACNSSHFSEIERELGKLRDMAKYAHSIGLEVHAGHGLDTGSVGMISAIKEIKELNIGHSLVSDAIFVGLGQAIKNIRIAMDEGRK